jgi:hypothetical protein
MEVYPRNAARSASRTRLARAAAMLLTLAVGFAGALSDVAVAQDSNRELIEDLLRRLMESETQSDTQSRSVDPLLARPLPTIDQNAIRDATRSLEDFAQEASRLTDDLYNERDRIPGVQPYFNDVLKVRARSQLLADKARQNQDARQIAAEFQQLDQDWRVLQTQLLQIPRLPQAIINRIERLNAFDKAIGQHLSIRPQLNRTELVRQTAALASDLNNLLEDIDAEVSQTSLRNELLVAGRRAEQQARRVSLVIADYVDQDRIVIEYKAFQALWDPFALKLRTVNNRYLERGVRRVAETDRAIHELLWLPQSADRSELLYLTEVLRRNIDEFFTRTPLRLLISLPRSEEVLQTADEFYGVCQNFADSVSRNEEDLAYTYGYIEDSWQRFNDLFRALKSQAALQVLAEIERSVYALRDELHLHDGFNRIQALELAASLENLADLLNEDTLRWLSRRPPANKDLIKRQASDFLTASRQLHQNLVTGSDVSRLRGDCSAMVSDWQRLQSNVLRCDTVEAPRLFSLSQQITPTLVELQTLMVP